MLGKTPGSITAIRPLKDGVISDFEVTEAMLSYFIRRVTGASTSSAARRHRHPVGHHRGREAGRARQRRARGARACLLVEGAHGRRDRRRGCRSPEPTASMIVDIGGGTTEVAIISLADISVSASVRTAGDDFDEAIVNHMKKTYNMAIGEQMAERIKIEIGSAAPHGRRRALDGGQGPRPDQPACRARPS
jgi:rod shape-determining protein MreB